MWSWIFFLSSAPWNWTQPNVSVFAHAGMWHSVKLNFCKGNAMPLWKPALSLHMASIAVSHKAHLLLTASDHYIPAKFGTWGLIQRYLQTVSQAQHRALPAHGQLGCALSMRLSDSSFVGHYFSTLEKESFRRMEPEEGNWFQWRTKMENCQKWWPETRSWAPSSSSHSITIHPFKYACRSGWFGMRISTGVGRTSYTGFDAGEGFCDIGDGPSLPTPSQSVRPIFVPTANSSTRVCVLVCSQQHLKDPMGQQRAAGCVAVGGQRLLKGK